LVRLLVDKVGIDDSKAVEQWLTWRRHGNAWFALEYGLVAGDIPRYGKVVLCTIIPLASLHSARFFE